MIPGLSRCVAKVLLKAGVNLITFGVGGELIDEIWNLWKQEYDAEQRRKELENLAQMSIEQIRQQATKVVAQEGSAVPCEIAQTVTTYLTQIPGHIRRSLRRASNPSGTTVSLAQVLRKSADLQRLLPERCRVSNPVNNR